MGWTLPSSCVTLDERALPESHTSKKLAEALKKVLLDCDLEESHISAVTVDNAAANIQKAIREVLGWNCLGCFGHTIN